MASTEAPAWWRPDGWEGLLQANAQELSVPTHSRQPETDFGRQKPMPRQESSDTRLGVARRSTVRHVRGRGQRSILVGHGGTEGTAKEDEAFRPLSVALSVAVAARPRTIDASSRRFPSEN